MITILLLVFAKNYLIIQNNQNFLFTKTDLNKYKFSSHVENILDFTQFQSQELKNSDREKISFKGGYIGFIGYDFSAHQFINNQSHKQPSLFIGSYYSFIKK